MPTLRQFQHVVALSDNRNFHRAAAAAGLSQPAFSLSIQKLEEEYGIKLFERNRREIVPTVAGEAVCAAARQALAHVFNLRRELDLLKDVETARIIIGCDTLIAETVLGQTLSTMRERYPQLRFSIHVGAWDSLINDLAAGRIDIYVGARPVTRDNRFAMIDIELPELIMVCRPGHPILELEAPTLKDCLVYPAVGPRVAPWFDKWLTRYLPNRPGDESQTVNIHFIESDDYGVIRSLVRNTDAITSAFPGVVAQDLANGSLVPIPVQALHFRVPAVIGTPNGKAQPTAIRALIDELVGAFPVTVEPWKPGQ